MPNSSFMLSDLTYYGPDPDAFFPRDAVIDLFCDYSQRIATPVQLGTEDTRIVSEGDRFSVETTGGHFTTENVVLANGAFQNSRTPAASAALPGHAHQLHSNDYRNPQQIPDGACWWSAPVSPAARSPRNCSPSAAKSIWWCPRARKHRAGTAARTSSTGGCSLQNSAHTAD